MEVESSQRNGTQPTLIGLMQDMLEPACAKACPTDSIVFGVLLNIRAFQFRSVATG